MAKTVTAPGAFEALFPLRPLEKLFTPPTPPSPPPDLFRACDILGIPDSALNRGISMMGNPPHFLRPQKVGQNKINDWRARRRKIPARHRAKICAYLEFGVKQLRKLARTAGIPSTSPIWSEYEEVEKIINKELNNPEILTAVKAYRQGFKAVFEETPSGRFFLEQQEKRILEIVGKKN
jgi:hypothetical protein